MADFGLEVSKLLSNAKHKGKHYNDKGHVTKSYRKVSTGSLKLDDKTGGGFDSGILTFYGITESGKTSMALKVMENFLKEPNTRGLYVKAEGRLSENVKGRYSIKFTDNPEDWGLNSCFVFKTNDYYLLIEFWDKIMGELAPGERIIMLVDSLNGLRDVTGTGGMASTPRITSDLLSKISLPTAEGGHLVIFTAQKRATIESKYTTNEERDPFSMSGGYAIQNYSDWILQFAPHDQKGSQFFEKKEDKEPIGHKCLITIKKSTNNTSNTRVDYPILYGRKDSEVWLEKELIDFLVMWKFIDRPTPKSSYTVQPYLIKETKEKIGVEVPETFRSDAKLMSFMNNNTPFVIFWVDKIVKRMRDSDFNLKTIKDKKEDEAKALPDGK